MVQTIRGYKMISGKNIDEVFYKICKKLKVAKEYFPRGQKTKELIQETIVIENPADCVVKNPARKLSLDYLKKEMEWYLSGNKNIKEIGKTAEIWNKIANKDGTVNSNYGEIVFKQKLESFNGSQWDWVVSSLLKDSDSRQAVINFNQTKHKQDGVKDFVCTLSIQYLIRENKLISICNMRSNDIIYGFCNDLPFFSYLQKRLLNELNKEGLNLKLGKMYYTVGSLHVYEKHFKMINNIINEYENSTAVKIKQWQKN